MIGITGNPRKRYSRFDSSNNGYNIVKDEQPATRTTNILVVDDEEPIRSLLRRILEKNGYHCTTASDVKEARTSMKETHFDLLLSDIKMPGMSGKILVDRLKKILPDLKVLFMSGYTDNVIVNHGILNSGTPFVQKPLTKRILGKAIRDVLHGS